MRFIAFVISFFVFLMSTATVLAQSTPQSAVQDTVKEFEIIRGPSMRMIKTDTGTLQTIAGGAVIYQGQTKFYADSIMLNNDTRNMQAFGNVRINDGDTVNIYAQYLRYNGDERTAYLRNNVRITGRNGTLITKELDYNLHAGIGNYYNSGRVVNNKDVITSVEGTYYADTKDVYFKKDVKMDGPKNHIRSDSLVYNMNNAGLTFISETYIQNNEVEINTSQGTYDTKTGNAFFSSRSVIRDSAGRLYSANTMALDGKTGNAQLEGDGVIIDSAGGYTILGNQIFLNRDNNSFLATKKPVLIIKQKHDSTYVAADIIFSGLAKLVNDQLTYPTDSATKLNNQQTAKIISLRTDSSENFLPEDSLRHKYDSSQHNNRLQIIEGDTVIKKLLPSESPSLTDKLRQQQVLDSFAITPTDTLNLPTDSSGIFAQDSVKTKDSAMIATGDTAKITTEISPPAPKDTLHQSTDSTRYFLAYHNVRIYNDSLQSVCDSMFISSRDSVFRLYYSPVIWSGKTQVTGDTMLLFTKNKEAERLFVFDRAMVVNQTKEGFFNQMAGKTLNAYFKNDKFDYIRLKGSQAECVYYLQDDDSAYIGMNRATSDVIDMLFDNGELQKIILINQVKGIMYPMYKIPEEQRALKDFEWLDKRRPKNRAELFL